MNGDEWLDAIDGPSTGSTRRTKPKPGASARSAGDPARR